MATHKEKIKDIKDALKQIADDMQKMSELKEWTAAVKQQLTILGREKYKYQVAPDLKKRDRRDKRAWLYDFTWWSKDGERDDRTSIELAVESEWNSNIKNLKIDFAKLVYARAKLKLFIFRAANEVKRKDKLTDLEKLAGMCEDNNHDKYLFSCFVKSEGKFIHNEGIPIKWE